MTRRHFTLVELLAAVMITAIVIPVVISAMSSATRSAEDSRRHQEAAVLAGNMMHELVATGDWRDASDRGDFTDADAAYVWTLQRDDWDAVDVSMRQLTLTVYRRGADPASGVTVVTLVNEEETE